MNFLLVPNKEQKIYEKENDKFKCITSEVQGWRINLEDSHIIDLNIENNISIFGVFDGHCGDEISRFCEKYYKKFLLESREYKNKNYEKALYESFIDFDNYMNSIEGKRLLKEFQNEEDNIIYSGTTAIILLIVDNISYIANLGDSRCILYNKENGFKNLSIDHKPENIWEKQRIENAGGFVKSNRINEILNISRTLGDFEFKKNKFWNYDEQLISCVPEIKTHFIEKNDDFFILGCDGLWEKMNENQICNFIKNNLNENKNELEVIKDLIESSISECLAERGCDNITIIFVKIK